MTASPTDFHGTDRFEILRWLGVGGMGVVYEVLDHERNERVALKTLRWADAGAIYRFKREFRILADVVHPNLVSLYELVVGDAEWFFTMELVDGTDFVRYARGEDPAKDASGEPVQDPGGPSLDPQGPDVPRLWSALGQLAQGLYTLHQAGKVHRDIKPSNILVTRTGRVVIMDFGITAEMAEPGVLETVEDGIWGSVAYMAPEQGEGTPKAPSDWYAVGTVLYRALTGLLPFTGSAMNVLYRKMETDPVSPDELVPGLPPDLVQLCRALMARDPAARPSGADVLDRLGVPAADVEAIRVDSSQHRTELVGRESHLRKLQEAFAATLEGQAVTVSVHGASGAGKTTLVQRFLNSLSDHGSAVVLSGRCYVRESVPYKALDGVVDSLSRYLRSLPRSEADALLPTDASELIRVFPVLSRVVAFDALPLRGKETKDQLELRRRAFGALRELLLGVAARQPVVLYVDDLHWADEDSAVMLYELLRPPHAPPILLVTSFRSEELDARPFLRRILDRTETSTHRQLAVAPLSTADTEKLVLSLAAPEGGTASEHSKRYTDRIVEESAGNPFLVQEMVRYLLTTEGSGGVYGASLGEMLDRRISQMPQGALPLLRTVAVAGHPVDGAVAYRAAGHSGDERPLLSALVAANLLRRSGSAGRFEMFHDRIRETLSTQLSEDARSGIHGALAASLLQSGYDDPEVLCEHCLASGQKEEAGLHAARAARRAAAALAFDHAAEFFKQALELAPSDRISKHQMLAELGDAQSNAGRVQDAAESYSRAAAAIVQETGSSDSVDVLEFRRRSAEQMLIGGRIEKGLEEIESVLRAARLPMAKTQGRALVRFLLRRIRLRLRPGGLWRFTERNERDIPPKKLVRIDVCRTVAEGLAHVSYIHAADFQSRHTLLSLKAGEPDRVARALAIESGFVALGGSRRSQRRSQRLLREAEALSARIDSAHALGLCALMAGTTSYFEGNWRRAWEVLDRAQQMLIQHGVGVAWELMSARLYRTFAAFYLGELKTLARDAQVFLDDAAQRGNRFASTIFCTGPANVKWLIEDDVDGAVTVLTEALAEWPAEPFRTPHYLAMTARGRIALYSDNVAGSWDEIMKDWPALRATGLLRIQAVRAVMYHIRGRCALAASHVEGDRRQQLLAAAESDARRVEGEGRDWCHALARLLQASIAEARGNTERACSLLREAGAGFERTDMQLHAAAARLRLGQLIGGVDGLELDREARAWMANQDIRNPDRMTAMLAPGYHR